MKKVLVKFIYLLSTVVVLLAICVAILLYRASTLEKARRIDAEDKLTKEQVLVKNASRQFLFSEKNKLNLERKLAAAKQLNASLESELQRCRQNIDFSKQRIAELEAESLSTKNEIGQANSRIAEVRNRIDGIVKDIQKSKDELSLLEKTRDALKERLSQFLRQKEASPGGQPGTTKPLTETGSPTEISSGLPSLPPNYNLIGEILTVNREFDFIVVNLGAGDGVKEGAVLDIYRDDTKLGEVQVETVRENISAAALLDKEIISQVRAGDKVVLH